MRQWLREQRVSGGTGVASSMLRTNASAVDYLAHITELVAKGKDVKLTVKESTMGFEVLWEDKIVWFGRDIDIDFLRTVSATTFERILEGRIDRLRKI